MSKEIMLKELNLKNFKGVKELNVNFGHVTNIRGDNGTGKTTIFDAFTWLLFDKDSCDRKSFEIKTLNSDNEVLHGLEHQVRGILLVEGREITLEKLHRERWTKKKGETDRILTGNETLYYIDGIPVKQSEYLEKVNSFINENIFKLITNPLYFSLNMKWQERREVILEIIGDVATEKVLKYKSSLKALENLLSERDIDTLRKSLAVRKKKLNEDIKAIPYRIDEINNSIKEVEGSDVELELIQYRDSLRDIEDKLFDSSKIMEESLKERNKLYKLKDKLAELEIKAKYENQGALRDLYGRLNTCEGAISSVESRLEKTNSKIQSSEAELSEIEKSLQVLREQWKAENENTLIIHEDSFICPTCRRTFDPEDIESKRMYMFEIHTKNKAARLSEINGDIIGKKERCLALKDEIKILVDRLQHSNMELEELKVGRLDIKTSIENFTPNLNFEGSEEYQKLIKEALVLEGSLTDTVNGKDEFNKLKEKKAERVKQIELCKEKLAIREQNEKFKGRINELMELERSLAKQIAELEKQEVLCEEFIKTKVELLESSINNKFKFVRFKLFNTLVNGSVEECCEALINGVPFSNANKASQINAGLDIINALSEHYSVSAPIFIDNRESINKILHCSSQLVNLIVSEDAGLKIERGMA